MGVFNLVNYGRVELTFGYVVAIENASIQARSQSFQLNFVTFFLITDIISFKCKIANYVK